MTRVGKYFGKATSKLMTSYEMVDVIFYCDTNVHSKEHRTPDTHKCSGLDSKDKVMIR